MQNAFLFGLLWNIVIAWGIISLVFLANLIRKKTMKSMDNLIALSVGLIIAIVFLWFLPEIISESSIAPESIGLLFLFGIFLFYIFELFLHWHHCKDIGQWWHHHDHTHEHENNALMFAGTFVHNVLHGFILYSAFSIDMSFGIATTIAVLLHAIPQNIANLLMNHKDTRYAYIAAFGGVFGAFLVYPFSDFLSTYNFHILALIGGGLLYTAMSDILPSFKEKWEIHHKIAYLGFMVLGVTLFFINTQLVHHEHWEEHDHENHQDEEHSEDHS